MEKVKRQVNPYQLKFSVFLSCQKLAEDNCTQEDLAEYLTFIRKVLSVCASVEDIQKVFPSNILKFLGDLSMFKSSSSTISDAQVAILRAKYHKGYELLNQFLLLRLLED